MLRIFEFGVLLFDCFVNRQKFVSTFTSYGHYAGEVESGRWHNHRQTRSCISNRSTWLFFVDTLEKNYNLLQTVCFSTTLHMQTDNNGTCHAVVTYRLVFIFITIHYSCFISILTSLTNNSHYCNPGIPNPMIPVFTCVLRVGFCIPIITVQLRTRSIRGLVVAVHLRIIRVRRYAQSAHHWFWRQDPRWRISAILDIDAKMQQEVKAMPISISASFTNVKWVA